MHRCSHAQRSAVTAVRLHVKWQGRMRSANASSTHNDVERTHHQSLLEIIKCCCWLDYQIGYAGWQGFLQDSLFSLETQ